MERRLQLSRQLALQFRNYGDADNPWSNEFDPETLSRIGVILAADSQVHLPKSQDPFPAAWPIDRSVLNKAVKDFLSPLLQPPHQLSLALKGQLAVRQSSRASSVSVSSQASIGPLLQAPIEAVESNHLPGYAFRSWRYATATVGLTSLDILTTCCLDSGCIMTMIDSKLSHPSPRIPPLELTFTASLAPVWKRYYALVGLQAAAPLNGESR